MTEYNRLDVPVHFSYNNIMDMRHCSLCGKFLSKDKTGGNGYYYCSKKHSAESRRIKQRDLHRGKYLYLLGEVGKRHPVRVNKRPRPNACELCGKERDRFHYHHWDDKKPERGMWVCMRCHSHITACEKGFCEKYLKLKNKLYP